MKYFKGPLGGGTDRAGLWGWGSPEEVPAVPAELPALAAAAARSNAFPTITSGYRLLGRAHVMLPASSASSSLWRGSGAASVPAVGSEPPPPLGSTPWSAAT